MGCALAPLVVLPAALEPFRVPKELLLRLTAIVVMTMAAVSMAWGRPFVRPTGVLLWLPAAVIIWSGICALTGSNLLLSFDSFLTISASTMIFVAVATLGRDRSRQFLWVIVLPGVVNAAIFLYETWVHQGTDDLRTALLGNRDDVGSFLCAAALAAIALALSDHSWTRLLPVSAAILITIALLLGAVTSLFAFVAGVTCMALLWSPRRGTILIGILLMSLIFALTMLPGMQARTSFIRRAIQAGDWDAVTSYRLTAYHAAWRMGTRNVVTGVGPGGFRFEFYDYKLAVERDHPQLLKSASRYRNFGEAHNDYLQVFAETGAVGLALLLFALAYLSIVSLRCRANGTERAGRILGLPLAITLAVLMMAHFPLELAAPRLSFLFLAALAFTWCAGPVPAHGEVRFRNLWIATASTCLISLVAGMATYFLVYEPLVCQIRARSVKDRTLRIVLLPIGPNRQAAARQNIDDLSGCNAWQYDHTSVWMLRAASYDLLGRDHDAVRMYRNALRSDRRPELYLNLGLSLINVGEIAAAKDALLRSVLFDFHLLDQVTDPVIHDWLETLVATRYPHVFPADRTPTLLLSD